MKANIDSDAEPAEASHHVEMLTCRVKRDEAQIPGGAFAAGKRDALCASEWRAKFSYRVA